MYVDGLSAAWDALMFVLGVVSVWIPASAIVWAAYEALTYWWYGTRFYRPDRSGRHPARYRT